MTQIIIILAASWTIIALISGFWLLSMILFGYWVGRRLKEETRP
jgi:uncharacterized iron-regulated membrane protein